MSVMSIESLIELQCSASRRQGRSNTNGDKKHPRGTPLKRKYNGTEPASRSDPAGLDDPNNNLPTHYPFCPASECHLQDVAHPSIPVCPICLNNSHPQTRLSARDTPTHHHQSQTPGFFSSDWTSFWSHAPAPSSPFSPCCPSLLHLSSFPRYKYASFDSHLEQWDASLSFQMSSKGYQKICPSVPFLFRFLLIFLLMATLPLTGANSPPPNSPNPDSPPPNYSQSNMPTTNFTCADKATGGYYADPEAHCQMFHVCVRISDDEMNDFRFLCPNDTVFDQQNFICTNWWEIDCERSTRYYSKNDLFKEGEQQTAEPEYEYGAPDSPVYYEYVYEYVDEDPKADLVEGELRQGLGKAQSEQPSGRAVETSLDIASHVSSTVATTKARRTSAVSSSPTTPQPIETTAVALTTRRPSTTPKRTSFPTPPSTTGSPKLTTLRTPHRLSFKPVSSSGERHSVVLGDTSSSAPPAAETAYASRGGSTFLKKANEQRAKEVILPSKEKGGSPPLREDASAAPQRKEGGSSSPPRESQDLDLDLDADDPYANYDWKRDSSGVTASARTRYEALFGGTTSRGRDSAPKRPRNPPPRENPKPPQPRRITTPKTTTTAPPAFDTPSDRRKIPESQIQREKQTPSDGKHKEFSNFRFYKTAFGRSYSSDDYLGSTGTSAAPLRVSDPVRLERTASRNTRYSIYGRSKV